MQFHTIGNPSDPVILMVHAMFCSSDMFQGIVDNLQDDYYVILPTLDAHDPAHPSSFDSAQEEADLILQYLKEQNIQEIDCLLGVSLGGIIAFEVFIRKQIRIHRMMLDGTPFLLFPKWKIKIMRIAFQWIAHLSAKHPDRKNPLDMLFPDNAATMKAICAHISDESIAHLARTCYTYQLPKQISLSSDEQILFLYGTKEKASMCIPTLQKFSNCTLILKEGYRHCELLSKESVEYSKMIKGMFDKNKNSVI